MKALKFALLPTCVLMLCGSGFSLFAPPATYEFFPIGPDPGFSGSITLDSSSDPSGTSADIVSWDITDPMGTYTPANSTVEPGGSISWDPSSISSLDVFFDVGGSPAFGINTTNIFVGNTPPAQSPSGSWDSVPETSNAALLLVLGFGGLGFYHLANRQQKA